MNDMLEHGPHHFERLVRALDGELDGAQRERLHQDLASDPALRAALASLALDRVLISELLMEEQEALAQASSVASEVAAVAEAVRPQRTARAGSAFALASSLLAAAAVLFGVFGLLAARPSSEPAVAAVRTEVPAEVKPPAPALIAAKAAAPANQAPVIQALNSSPALAAVARAPAGNSAPRINGIRLEGPAILTGPMQDRAPRKSIQLRVSEPVIQLQ